MKSKTVILFVLAVFLETSCNGNDVSLSQSANAQSSHTLISSCFDQAHVNKLIEATPLPAGSDEIQLDADLKVQVKSENILVIKGTKAIDVPVIDRRTNLPLQSWSGLVFDKTPQRRMVTQYGDCLAFFVVHPSNCDYINTHCHQVPILFNTKEERAVTLGDQEFDKMKPTDVAFFENQILIGNFWTSKLNGFSDYKTQAYPIAPFGKTYDTSSGMWNQLSNLFVINGSLYVSHYAWVTGYDWNYSILSRVDDLSSGKVSQVFKEPNRLISHFNKIDQDFGLGTFLNTFLYDRVDGIEDGNRFSSFQFGLLNKDGEFKILGSGGPDAYENEHEAPIHITKQSDGTFIVSWIEFHKTIQARIDDLGNKIDSVSANYSSGP